jgi:subfamily B ATP-binding cassette protein MsbA
MALLQRLYEPIAGQILIDDVPIEQYDIHYLRSRIVMVDQHTVRRRRRPDPATSAMIL